MPVHRCRPSRLRVLALAVVGFAAGAPPTVAAEDGHEPALPKITWPHDGVFGTIDKAAAQRGLQVYREVCAACHSLRLMPFRALAGIGYSDEQIKAIAAEFEVDAGPNDQGEMFKRPAVAADRFPSPYANEALAKLANGGALPPDLSLIVKAREGGADYLHAYLVGFRDPPPDIQVPEGMHYNAYFPGHLVAMPNVLFDGNVTYQSGEAASAEQQARDVTTFLTFVAEPHHDERKRMGIKVVLFLSVFAGLLYATKRRLWRDVH